MRYMFYNCSSLTSLDVSNFDTAKVPDMNGMFYNCSKLTSLDVSNFNTAKVTSMGSMFCNCSSLTNLDVSNFNTANVTNMYGMFYNCSSLTNLDVSSFNTANVTNMYGMFYNCSKLTSLDVSNFNTAKVTSMGSMFCNCSSLTNLDVSNFNTANVTNMYGMFSNCSKLTSLDLSNFDTANVTDMGWMFCTCSSLTNLDLSSFNTANVTDMGYMFCYCSSLTNLDVSNFNTANVTNMYGMFSNCSKLTSLDLSNFDTANVTDMGWMFCTCSSLTSLDVSNFDTANVTDMGYMFSGDSKLKYVVFGNNFKWEKSNGFSSTGTNWKKVKDENGIELDDTTKYSGIDIESLTSFTTPTLAGTWQKLTFEEQSKEFYYSTSIQEWKINGASDGTGSYVYEESQEKNGNNEQTNYIEISEDGKITISASAPVGDYSYIVRVTDTNTTATTTAKMTISIKYPSLTLNVNGGEISGTNVYYPKYGTASVYSAEKGTEEIKMNIPTKTGHTFVGWYTEASDGNQILTSDNIGTGTEVSGYMNTAKQWVMVEDKILYAHWEIDESQTKELSYTVEYYKDGKVVSGDTQTETNTVQILQPDTLTVNKDKINTSNKYVGYKLAKIEVNTEEKDIPSIVNNGDVIKVYYVKNTSVIVKYLEKGNTDNLVLADEEIIEGYIGKDYTTEQKEIENYTFVESTNNTSGTMTETPITVIYYYLQNTKVIVNHIDKNSGEMLKTITEEGKVGDEYTSKSDNFEGYVLVESPENTTVTMAKDTITLNYYYVKVSEGVIEKHVNIITGEILYNELHEGNEGTSYETTSKEFESYQMVTNKMYYLIDENLLVELEKYTEEEQEELKEAYEVSTLEEIIANYKEEILDKVLKDKELNAKDSYIPENHEGIMKPELIEVIYYYIRPASVKTMYVDIVTGNELETPDYKYGYEGDEYETQEKEIQDYKLVEEKYPTNSKGTMEVTVSEDGVITPETTVTYYYVHNAKVVEKHINVKTNELIEETTYEGSEGDSYKTTSKEFEGYDLVESKLPESAEGTMTVDEIEVNYYYIRKTNVVVEYIDKNTGKNLLEKVEDSSEDEKTYTEVDSTEYIYGHEGDSYKTEEKKFESYVLVETSNNTEGTMETTVSEDGTIGITIYVKYYYAHPSSGVVEKPIDIMTGELIEKETIYEGYEGDSYKTTSKEFEGYDLVESKLPENAEGTMTLDEIEVKYYYIRKIKITVEYLEVGTDKKLAENEEINGHEGDSYIANSKDINGFTLVESPENATGTMGKTNIKVTYRYKANTAVENKENITSTTTVINNTQTTIINNNTQQSSTQPATTNANTSTNSNTSKISSPSTGDIAPVVAVGTIFAVVILNLIQIKISNSKKSVNKKRKKHKIKGKRYK